MRSDAPEDDLVAARREEGARPEPARWRDLQGWQARRRVPPADGVGSTCVGQPAAGAVGPEDAGATSSPVEARRANAPPCTPSTALAAAKASTRAVPARSTFGARSVGSTGFDSTAKRSEE